VAVTCSATGPRDGLELAAPEVPYIEAPHAFDGHYVFENHKMHAYVAP
jgi:hypothetical protein